ncbi:hypothetical protein C8R43DRAFT_874448 [Mycena crocata]|nr:hypothetical protein C8R43DRAFT_874448 [Mycena crocata]
MPQLHKVLVLRNMHDKGGADIPVIVTDWDDERTLQAMEYWVDSSEGEWSEEEQPLRYTECDSACRRTAVLPCFFQTDLLVRALLSDPAVGYVPPFIIFHSALSDGKTTVLFTKPVHVPPTSLIQDLPGSCNASQCSRTDCAAIDMTLSRSLVENSHMVRKWETVAPKCILCNLWGCNVKYSEDGDFNLQRCQRCREVLYCSKAHQTLDWKVHKNVCEKRF